MKKWLFILPFLLFSLTYYSQNNKLKITPKAYSEWNEIGEPQISNEGNIITYISTPQVGDQKLIIENKNNSTKREFDRGEKAFIAPNEQWVVFSITNYHDSIRLLKITETPKNKWPLDTLAIYVAEKDSLIHFPNVKTYKKSKDAGNWLSILRSDEFKINKKLSKKEKKKLRKNKGNLPKENGSFLTLFNPLTYMTKQIASVKEYTINKTGDAIYYTTSYQYHDSIDSCFLYRFNAKDASTQLINKHLGTVIKLNSSKSGDQFSYLLSGDTIKEKKYQLFYWNLTLSESTLIVDTISQQFSSLKSISEFHTPYFSDNGEYLFFKVGNKPIIIQKDSLTDDEKYSLDLWSWTDKRIQPQQLKNLKKDKQKADLYLYKTTTKTYSQLIDSTFRIRKTDITNNEKHLLLYTQEPYLIEMTWDGWYYDYYRIDVETGNKTLLKKHHNDQLKLSSSGRQAVYYSRKDSAWFHIDIEQNKTIQLTHSKYFHNQYHDTPGDANSIGRAYWNKSESQIIIKGQYDYWSFSLKESTIKQITFGRKNKTIYSYWKTTKREEKSIDFEKENYFLTRNEITKAEGIASLKQSKIKQLFLKDKQIFHLKKAKNTNNILYREMSFTVYPELQLTDLQFNTFDQLTDLNPQQKDYNWGTVELVNWKSYHNSNSLSGLLYKPEDFDSTKSYPMIVYFYERNTQNYHRYYAPRPTASIVHPTEYVSNGYLVFIPDIKYEIGKPAQGAYDCIVSGTRSLLKSHPYIDSSRLGLQGQSWGGYQTAQLITMTNLYKCAMAGAPVSNMFSAYGGIRWGSGLNRAFQYEKGQSRIGKTIWEAPELYIENSPIFHLQKVTTPLLIMHNDGDGAVPWYQGIELFNGLRRLQKPVWMLNYNGDAHNLRKRANKIDLSIRMKAFFDYYLLNSEAPKWILNGRPALIKNVENNHQK